MGIASFSPSFSLSRFGTPGLSMVLAPVHSLVALFMPVQPVRTSQQPIIYSPEARLSNAQNIVKQAPAITRNTPIVRPISHLKIIREFEPGIGRSQTGRMAISGRMADVCAELDRIAQKATPTA